ncbi:asparaginase [Marivivens marinus]|uniref:asparaginase n=1 Tax=Marivivens marinus TaxID=3110173 RepID=UPI003B84B163
MPILLIHTGGTIGMDRTERGYAPRAGVVEDAIAELRAQGELREVVDILRLDPLIDSANATPADWTRVARAVFDNLDAYDGFVVTHGTDTLAYTAAALCFALEGLNRPVILTGSMLPLTQPGSDGWANLSNALDAATMAPAGVWVKFAGNRLHGARVRKSHSSAPDAFEAAEESTPPRVASAQRRVHDFGTHDIAILSVAPGVSAHVIRAALTECDGVVLRCYGSGTVPDSPALRDALTAARDKGTLVIAVSQCPEGRIALGTYAAGAVLVDAGVVDGADITVEAAYVKLAHVLSRGLTPDQSRAELTRLQCGEASL